MHTHVYSATREIDRNCPYMRENARECVMIAIHRGNKYFNNIITQKYLLLNLSDNNPMRTDRLVKMNEVSVFKPIRDTVIEWLCNS